MFSLNESGTVARITLDRGEKRNAIPMSHWKNLERLVHEANKRPTSVIVFQSNDMESFCAGSDLVELRQLTADTQSRRKFRGAMESVMSCIRAVNKPTVALIRGGCFGTGVSLATACDIRVAHPDARFAITPAEFGISYPQSDLDRLKELVGRGQAARLVYGCERIDGREAHRIGLVEILDEAEAEAFGTSLIEGIAENSPVSLRALKAGLLNRFGTSESFDACFGMPEFTDRSRRHAAAKSPPSMLG